jgi:hypothetical protein
MTCADGIEPTLDYKLCRYGGSRLDFRGPPKRPGDSYITVLGGSETFGRHVLRPYCDLLQEALGTRTINLGLANAGLDAFLNDGAVLDMAAGARLNVLQVLGAQNLSNRYYTVHPRRNDRFVRVTPLMRRVYPEVDFTDFHYTQHMLGALQTVSRHRFALVRGELQRCWVARMNQLAARLARPVLLVWIGTRRPDDPAQVLEDGGPMFVTRTMLNALRGRIVDIVEMPPLPAPALDGKIYAPGEEEAAMRSPGPAFHEALSEALETSIARSGRLS